MQSDVSSKELNVTQGIVRVPQNTHVGILILCARGLMYWLLTIFCVKTSEIEIVTLRQRVGLVSFFFVCFATVF